MRHLTREDLDGPTLREIILRARTRGECSPDILVLLAETLSEVMQERDDLESACLEHEERVHELEALIDERKRTDLGPRPSIAFAGLP